MSELTHAQLERLHAAVDALPPMPDDALTRVAVLFSSLDEQQRRRLARERVRA